MSKQLINQPHVMRSLIALGDLDNVKKKMNLPSDFGEDVFFEQLAETSGVDISIIKKASANRRTHYSKTVRDFQAIKSTYDAALLAELEINMFKDLPQEGELTGAKIIDLIDEKADEIKATLGRDDVEECKTLSAYADVPEHLGGSGQGRSPEMFDEL